MSNEMVYLMHLYACAARSQSANPPSNTIDFSALAALADQMSLVTALSYALKISPQVDCPEEIRQSMFSVMLGTSLKNKIRIDNVMKLLEDIEKEGIKAVVIKGLDCARYYARPECRISADTDLLVDPMDEERLLCYLEQRGFVVHRRPKHGYHSECFSESAGVFEVHIKLVSDVTDVALLKQAKRLHIGVRDSQLISADGHTFRVLNPNAAIMFMTLHYAKHYIFDQVSVKQAYDLALYYVNNREEIDENAYRKWLYELGFDTLISATFSCMVRFCGFDKVLFDNLIIDDETRWQQVADYFEMYNSSEAHLPDLAVMFKYYGSERALRKYGKVRAFFMNAESVIANKTMLLFPKISHLAKTYTYLNKHPYLYPIACIHRFFARGITHLHHGDPKNGSLFRYQQTLQKTLSDEETVRLKHLKEMGLM